MVKVKFVSRAHLKQHQVPQVLYKVVGTNTRYAKVSTNKNEYKIY